MPASTATGHRSGPLPAWVEDAELLRRMYRMMVRARTFDTKAVNLQRTGKLGTYPSCLGHEATHVGVGAAMHADDVLFTVYREIGTKFWRGVDMLDILLYWGGDERGTSYPQLAAGLSVLRADRLADAARGRRRAGDADPRSSGAAPLAFIGDGGTSQGAFYEAINLAGVKSLPLVCVIVNNRWAISVPVAAQTAAQTLAQKAIAAGIPALQVDGNDLLIVRDAVGEAVERARAGGGPTVIEALTYRLSDHTTSDDATRYRSADEVAAAHRLEPIARMRNFLQSRGLWDEADEQALKRRSAPRRSMPRSSSTWRRPSSPPTRCSITFTRSCRRRCARSARKRAATRRWR